MRKLTSEKSTCLGGCHHLFQIVRNLLKKFNCDFAVNYFRQSCRDIYRILYISGRLLTNYIINHIINKTHYCPNA